MSVDEIVQGITDKANTSVDPTTQGVDHITLYEVVYALGNIISTVGGILAYLILILLPIIIAFEICYICFPIVRNMHDYFKNLLHSGNKTSGIALRTFEFTFKDAVRAILEAETAKTGKSALLIYLGIKLKSIIFLTCIIALVLLGTDTIVAFIQNMFSGVIDLITEIVYK